MTSVQRQPEFWIPNLDPNPGPPILDGLLAPPLGVTIHDPAHPALGGVKSTLVQFEPVEPPPGLAAPSPDSDGGGLTLQQRLDVLSLLLQQNQVASPFPEPPSRPPDKPRFTITNRPPRVNVVVDMRDVPLSVMLRDLVRQGAFAGHLIMPGTLDGDPLVSLRYSGPADGLLELVRRLAELNGFRAYMDITGVFILAPRPVSPLRQQGRTGAGSSSPALPAAPTQ